MQKGMVTHRRAADPANGPKYIHVYVVKGLINNYAGWSFQVGPTVRQRGAEFNNTVVIGSQLVESTPNAPAQPHILAHEVGHALGLKHPTEKLATDPTLTDAELLTSRTRVMGKGFYVLGTEVDQSVLGHKRFDLAEGSEGRGVHQAANYREGIVKKATQ